MTDDNEDDIEDSSEDTGLDEEFDYDKLLDRARGDLPEDISDHDRFQVPDIDVFIEGNTTIFRNFNDIADSINRDPDKLMKHMLRELGTAGEKEDGRVVFKGKIPERKIKNKLEDYIEKYVLCSECGRPDTRLVKEGRINILRCDACGAHRPVRGKKKKSKTIKSDEIKEGGIYEVLIQDVGREGDGMARVGKYTIYIPGTAKGDRAKIRIEHIKGTLAFGSLVGKGSN